MFFADSCNRLFQQDIVMSQYSSEVSNPIKNLVIGDLARGILIQVQNLKVDLEEAILTLDQIVAANAINFNLLATIPALVLGGGTLFFAYREIRTRILKK